MGEARRGPTLVFGSADIDIRILVNNAIQLLRTSMVAKVQMQATLNKPRGRPKRDGGISAAIDADRFAMASLEEVAKSSALNINCIMRPQQANLIWHLYISLVYLVTPPPLMPPRQQQSFNMVPYSVQNPATIQAAIEAAQAAHQQGARGAQGPPVPHQFLLRDQQQMHPPPGLSPGTAPLERVNMYTPGLLSRSGQSMRFSFPQHHNAQSSPNEAQDSRYPQSMRPHPGTAPSPGMQHRLAGQHIASTPHTALNGYPHPGAVVEDR